MKVFFDVTKTSRQGHGSGITRTARRLGLVLGRELGDDWVPVVWRDRSRALSRLKGAEPVRPQAGDWFLTCEPFSPDERKGFVGFLNRHPCRMAAVFHDAIPLRHPEFTWPKSVARFPGYLKMLAGFDHVFAVSNSSRRELSGYLEWLGAAPAPQITVVRPGADFTEAPRPTDLAARSTGRMILSVGILEPRKNQLLLLEACERLWDTGLSFDLILVGRVNPHFGKPAVAQVRRLRRLGRPVTHAGRVDDGELHRLLSECRFLVFPSRAEGCGLPVLEALWMGAPSLCSDLPSHRESAEGGGCALLPVNDPRAWENGLHRYLTDDSAVDRLAHEARERSLPTWQATGTGILRVLAG
ncbi:MAG: glycosyltransferase family 1 protein [Opitutaceae bacterium]